MIPPDDLKVEAAVRRPKGGQQVGFDASVRVTHIPTSIEAVVDIGRSQHRNRQIAVEMIEAALTSPNFR